MATPPPLDDEEVHTEEPVNLVGVDLSAPEPAPAQEEEPADEEVPIHEPETTLNEEPPVITLDQATAPSPSSAPVSLHVDLHAASNTEEVPEAAAPAASAAVTEAPAAAAASTAASTAAAPIATSPEAETSNTATVTSKATAALVAEAASSAAAASVPPAHEDHGAIQHNEAHQSSVPEQATSSAVAGEPTVPVALPDSKNEEPSLPTGISAAKAEASSAQAQPASAATDAKDAPTAPAAAAVATTPAPAAPAVVATPTAAPAPAVVAAPAPAPAPAVVAAPAPVPAAPSTAEAEQPERSAPRVIIPSKPATQPEPSPFLLSPLSTVAPSLSVASAASGSSAPSSNTVSPVASPGVTPAPAAVATPVPALASSPTPTVPLAAPAPAPASAAAAAAAAAVSAPRAASSWEPSAAEPAAGVPSSTGLVVTVTDPERVGDGFSSYMAYTVRTKTKLPQFSTENFSVKHRYSDFFSLFKYLESQYPGTIVPTPPPKDAISTGLAKFKSGSENSAFVERRTHALSRFMGRIAAHPQLFSDDVLRVFLTSGEKIDSKISVTPKKEFGDGEPGSEELKSKDWFDMKIKSLEALDNQLKKFHALLDTVVDRRKDLAASVGAFVEAISAAGNAEEVQSLSKALHTLADVEARVAKLHTQEAQTEFFDLHEIVDDYLGLLTATRTALSQRQQAQKDVQSAEATLAKKREAESKAKPEKKEQATRDVNEAERLLRRARKAFHEITLRVTHELLVFDATKVEDFKTMVVKYVESLIGTEEQILRAWEQFLPFARAISV